MTVSRLRFTLFAFTLSVAAVAFATDGSTDDDVVATSVDGAVTRAQYDSWRAFRGAQKDSEVRLEEIEQMLLVRTLANQAKTAGLDKTEEARRIFAVYELKALGQALRKQRARGVEVSEEEIDAALNENPKLLRRPARVRVRTLFKRAPEEGGDDAPTTAHRDIETLRNRVVAGEDFATLARAHSDSQTRFRDGLLGLVERGELPPRIEEIVFALQPGEVSDIVPTNGGFSLFYCERLVPPAEIPLEEARENLAGRLEKRAARKDWEQYVETLLAGTEIRYPEHRPAAPTDTVASYRDGAVSLDDVRAWRFVQGQPTTADTPATELRATARQVVEGRIIAAEQGDLTAHPDLREHLEWQETAWLATTEIARRLREIVAPLDDAAVREYFDNHRKKFFHPEQFDLSVIQIRATREDLQQRYREALALQAALAQGELDFAAAAASHSQHPSRVDGGRLETLARPTMAAFGANLFKTVIEMEPGEISRLVQQDLNLWIVQLHDREPLRLLEFDEAREDAQKMAGQQALLQARGRLEAELRAALEVRLVS